MKQIEIERGDGLQRKLWVFHVGELALRLIRYHEQRRATKRHKYVGKMWDCADERAYHSGLKRPTTIPRDVAEEALKIHAEMALAADIYVGWWGNDHLLMEKKS